MATVELAATVLGEGPPLIILHGLLGSARNWAGVAQRLAERHAVHALDLRNHGASPWAETMAYNEMAADVLAYAAARGLGPAAVIGHSMGGKVAMQAALARPEVVERLVVVDIAPVEYPPINQPFIDALRSVDPAGAAQRREVDARLAPLVPDLGIRQFLMQNLVAEGGGLRWRVNLPAIDRAMPAISGFTAPPGAAYGGPALFLHGGRSDYVRPEHHPAIRALFPQARIQAVAEAGHWVHAERPAEFLQAVQPFLAGG
ncbi:MAG TPA: alpha/beta fold hydrolase [Alphaproteobacteria bacterium]|nr:alpha/beta fold hydrolase [Alphaproteobacteria bacterium]